MNEKDLLKLKEEIDDKKSQISKLNGQKEMLIQDLKTTWHCSNIKEAEKRLKEMGEQEKAIEKQIQEGTKRIEESYEL